MSHQRLLAYGTEPLVAHDGIGLAEIDTNRLRRQIRRGVWTVVTSLIMIIVLLLILAKSPRLSGVSLDLVLFVLATLALLFVVAVVTTAGPMVTAFLLQRFKAAQKSLEVAEVQDNLEVASEIMREILKVEGASRLEVIERRGEDMRRLATGEMVIPS